MDQRFLAMALLASIMFAGSPAAPAHAAGKQRSSAAVQLTGAHMLLNQAYQMVLEGSNLVMAGSLEGTGAVGGSIIAKGHRMIEEGHNLIGGLAAGGDLDLLKKDQGETPMVRRVAELAQAMLEATETINSYLAARSPGGHQAAINQLFMLLNHGMKMATDGANMIVNGRVGVSSGASEYSQRHGRAMMRDGRVLIVRLSTNATMKELQGRGVTPAADPRLDLLNKSIIQSLQIIDTLARM